MNSTTLILFISTIFVLCISPGPTMLLAMATGMNSGVRVALWGALGATGGNSILIFLVAFGLGSLLTASLTLFTVLKFVGALYLCWLAYHLWHAKATPIIVNNQPQQSAKNAFLRAAMVALTNPKGILFLTVFLPQFINIQLPSAPQYAILGILLLGMDAIMMVLYILLGRHATRFLTVTSLRWLNRSCAVFMGFLAAGLATFSRS